MEPELRDWYLATLGIVQYRLRSADTTCFPANDIALNQQVPGQPAKHVLEASDDGVKAAQVAIREAPGLPAAIQRPPHSVKLPAENAPPTGAGSDGGALDRTPDGLPEEPVTFRLACWRPSEDLLVIDSWPTGRGQDPQLLQLLMNILRSVRRLPDSLKPAEFIDWPIPGDRQISEKRGIAAAQDHVAMFLQGRYEQQSFKWLLAMGDDLRGYLMPHQAQTPSAVRQQLSCGAVAIFTHSLTEMISAPQCKKDVWAAIRFLGQP